MVLAQKPRSPNSNSILHDPTVGDFVASTTDGLCVVGFKPIKIIGPGLEPAYLIYSTTVLPSVPLGFTLLLYSVPPCYRLYSSLPPPAAHPPRHLFYLVLGLLLLLDSSGCSCCTTRSMAIRRLEPVTGNVREVTAALALTLLFFSGAMVMGMVYSQVKR